MSQTKEVVVVVTATGKIGQCLLKLLSKEPENFDVRGITRKETKSEGNIKYFQLDSYKNQKEVDAILEGATQLVIVKPVIADFVGVTRAYCEAAKKSGTIKHIAMITALGAAEDAEIEFSREEYKTELLVEETKIPYTHLRPTFFYANFLDYAASIMGEGVFYNSRGDTKCSFIDVNDVAKVILSVLKQPAKYQNQVLTLTADVTLSAQDQADIFEKVFGKKLQVVPLPAEIAEAELLKAGMEPKMTQYVTEMFTMAKEGKVDFTTTTLQEVIGERPVSFEEFLRENATVFSPQQK